VVVASAGLTRHFDRGADRDSPPIFAVATGNNQMERFSLVLNRFLAHIASAGLALLMFLTVVDVLGRYLFNRPVTGTFELTEMSMVLIVFLALGLAQHHQEHISLDLAYIHFPSWLKKATDLTVDLVNLAIVGAMTWQLYNYFVRMRDGNYTTAVLQLPIHPFVIVALAGVAAYLLAILCGFGAAKKSPGENDL
jgi:TRAP-type C4-dicarboxylate transport system permease small subunit